MKIIISTLFRDIFIILVFACSFAHANSEPQRMINSLLDEVAEIEESLISNLDHIIKSLSESPEKINQRYIDEYRILSKKYNDCVFLLNSIIINNKTIILKYNLDDKIARISKASDEFTKRMYVLLDKDTIFSDSQTEDIYELSRILTRYIESPSLFISEEQYKKDKKTWDHYRSISKTLFNLECYLRKIASNENISIDALNEQFRSLDAMHDDVITMRRELRSKSNGHDGEIYEFPYDSIANQYLYIYEQALVLESKKYEPIVKKIIAICQEFFINATKEYYIVEDHERSRYIRALKTSGKVIIPKQLNGQ